MQAEREAIEIQADRADTVARPVDVAGEDVVLGGDASAAAAHDRVRAAIGAGDGEMAQPSRAWRAGVCEQQADHDHGKPDPH
jgi:hypothetical protein